MSHRDDLGGLGDLLHRRAELAREAVEAPALEHRQVVAHDARGQRIVGEAELAQLDQQALGQAARRHPGRIELLQTHQHALDHRGIGPHVGQERRLLERHGEVAVLVEAADQDRADFLVRVREIGEPELPHEVIGQEGALDEDVLERGSPVVVVARRVAPARSVHVVAVVLGELFPVDLPDARRLLDLGWRVAVRLPVLGAGLAVDRGHRVLGLLLDLLLEERILGELLVDEGVELRARDLQDLDRHAELRRHHELL